MAAPPVAAPPIYQEMTARRLFGNEFYPSSLSSESSGHPYKFHKGLSQHGLRIGQDGFVDWKYNASQLPYNWSSSKKAYHSIAICFFEFCMMASSSAGTSASMHASTGLGISQLTGFFVFTSIYLFGQAIGSVLFADLSHTYGRKNLYIISNTIYCVFSALVSAVPSVYAVGIGRFVTGVASAIPATLALASFEDMHSTGTRIWTVYIYTLVGNCGLVLGPIYSAYISSYAGWRFVFYISAVLSFLGIAAATLMRETHIDYLLESSARGIVKSTGDNSFRIHERKKVTLQALTSTGLAHPLQILVTEPIVMCCAVLMMMSFSLIYGFTEALIIVYTEFGFSESTTSSLAFLPILLGLLMSLLPRFYDQRVLEHHKDGTSPTRAEIKTRSLMISCPSLAFGLWLFAWTIPPKVLVVPWELSMIGLVFVGYATNDFAYVLFGYLTDTYGEHATSACIALNLSRTVMAALFPLFTWNMYMHLGSNLATTVFATIATIFCVTPFIFIKFGGQPRRRNRYAYSDWDDRETRTDEEKIDRQDSLVSEFQLSNVNTKF